MGVGLSLGAARALTLVATLVPLTVGAAGCGGEPASPAPPPGTGDASGPGDARDRSADPRPRTSVEVPDAPACIDEGAACVQAGGRILYVERVDPDGDGDAHLVTSSADSVTAPGITVFDVRADLRPDPLPGPGDAIAASGPVLEGSFGQRQIEADAVAVAYAR